MTNQIRKAVNENIRLIRAGDLETMNALQSVIAACMASDVRFYPREILALRTLQARIYLIANDRKGVRDSIGFWLDRPHAAEAGFTELRDLYWLDGALRLLEGADAKEIGAKALRRLALLAKLRPRAAFFLAFRFGSLVAVHDDRSLPSGPLRVVGESAKTAVRLRRPWNRLTGFGLNGVAILVAAFGGVALTIYALTSARRIEAGPQRAAGDDVVVSRAMGGIGDLIMMSPGLRALARRYRRPVKFVTSRKFFPVFENNPNVELIDAEGADFDLSAIANWRNLTICPAVAYESRAAPFVKRGRVRLFAHGMGAGWTELQASGTRPEIFVGERDRAFAEAFLERHGFGGRPLIGVQPYSRDSYKDHPDICAMIEKLAQEFDVLLFHHVADGLPQGDRIAMTAGLALGQSLALAQRLDALVSVDSAFLHAASAFDVPVVALFGPTDGKVVADHHDKKVVVTAPPSFICMPCWRNEDLPCKLTGQVGISPCMAAISYARVRSALDEALAMRVGSG